MKMKLNRPFDERSPRFWASEGEAKTAHRQQVDSWCWTRSLSSESVGNPPGRLRGLLVLLGLLPGSAAQGPDGVQMAAHL